jgi:transcriptional regulator of acetoin/glycerol metabolism
MMAVNAAITLQRPLLVKGEPGTGKTMLAEEIAASLGRQLIVWPIKSTTKPSTACMNTMRYPPARFPTGRRQGPRHQQLHHQGAVVAGLRGGYRTGVAD